MTLDEAIKHCEEIAEEAKRTPCIKGGLVEKCGREHDQLAHWLEELRQLRKDAEPNAWIYQIKTTGFGNYPVLVCGYCGKERRQVPLSFCANCGKRMHNAKELEENAT